ncbi:MAG: type II/IV secretion system protein, partial [bacterium]|nr:type II/IV secretion system protein [bacterium]
KYYPPEISLGEAFSALYEGESDQRKKALTALGVRDLDESVVRAVESLLHDAVTKGVSDIHLEPEGVLLRVRYRLDGILKQIRTLHKDHWQGLNIRLKVLSGLNVGESYVPQSGGFGQVIGGHQVDFRVSTHPTVGGENMVIRLLDRSRSLRTLTQLGFRKEDMRSLENVLKTPEGMILVTGPTGSGKTTTLYGMIQALRTKEINIMTLEDPVEYRLPLIRQTEINLARDVGFSQGVRSILRQDPDVVFIGEIRDEETAQMAVRSALTGHQVFGTLHTNSALGALVRLKDLGVPKGMLSGNIIALMSQRLVRKLCENCKVPDKKRGGFVHRGCPTCLESGYQGREAIAEILPFNMEANDLLASKVTLKELRDYFLSQGVVSLKEHAAQKVAQGITSVQEAERVVGPLFRAQGEA